MITVKASKTKGMIWLEQFHGEKHIGTCGFDYKNTGKVAQKIFHYQGVYWGECPEKLEKEEISSLLDKINRAYNSIHNYREALLKVEAVYVETASIWVIEVSNANGKTFILATEKTDGFINSVKQGKVITFSDGSNVVLNDTQISELAENIESINQLIVQMNSPVTNTDQNCRETIYAG